MSEELIPGKYVVTGGSGFGKTSIIKEFRKRGFFVVNESSRDLIVELKEKNSKELPWIDRPAFQKLITERRIEDYKNVSNEKACLFDRGVPDEIAYYEKDGYKTPDKYIEFCKENKYTKVFITPPWEEIYETDDVRKESFEESSSVHNLIVKAYKEFGYDLIEIPKVSVKERVDFIIENIKKS